MGWWKDLASDLFSAEANLGRDFHNVGGNWRNLRPDQKANLLLRHISERELMELDDDDIDRFLERALG